MMIAFWSLNRRTGTTASLLAVSSAIAMKLKRSCLLTQTYIRQDDLESIFTKGMTDEEFESVTREMGTDSLIRQFKAGKLDGEAVFNCSVEVIKNLSYLPASRKTLGMMTDENARNNIMRRILSASEERFDVAAVDIGAGREEEDMDILNSSDMVVVVCEQGKRNLEKYLDKALKMGIPENKLFFVLAKYLTGSKYSISNLRHFYENIGIDSIGAVPASSSYLDAIEDQKPMTFLQCFDRDAEFVSDPQFYAETVRCGRKLIEKAGKNARKRYLGRINGDNE